MYDRRTVIVAGSSAAFVAGSGLAKVSDPDSSSRQIYSDFEELHKLWSGCSPEGLTELGMDTGPNDAQRHMLDDRSSGAYFSFMGSTKKICSRLESAKPTNSGRQAAVYRSILVDQILPAAEGALRFRFGTTGDSAPFFLNQFSLAQPYIVGTLSGAYQGVPDFLINKHPLNDVGGIEAYLDRLRCIPRALDEETLRIDHDSRFCGVIPPICILEPTISRFDALLSEPAEESPVVRHLQLHLSGARLPQTSLRAAVAIAEREIKPALRRQRDMLESLRRSSSTTPGVLRFRDGEEYYAWCLQVSASTKLPADDVHRIGLDEVANLSSQLHEALRRFNYTNGSVGERLRYLAMEPRFKFRDDSLGKTEILAAFRELTSRSSRTLPRNFGRLPEAALDIRAVPEELEAFAPRGYYQRGDLGRTRNAVYYANLRTTADWSKFYLPTFAFHEGVPGHHLQFALAAQAEDVPHPCRYLQINGFSEGWAVYAEQLADEAGLYADDPWGRIGYLQSTLLRAARLVVDTGLHQQGWSVDKCVSYLVDVVGETPERSRSEILRYVSWPGNACSYKLGHHVFNEIRQEAATRLAERFDIRAFHDQALRFGAMPLETLRSQMSSWTEDVASGHAEQS